MNWETTLKKITDETALNAAMQWVDRPANLTLVNNQINCVYRFERKNKDYYLRITHEQIRPINELEAAIDFQQHLFMNNAPVCPAMASKNDRLIEPIQQDDLVFLAHVCHEVPGAVMHFEHTDKHVYTVWGQSLARLHRASQTYQPKEHPFRTWKDLWQETTNYAEHESKDIKRIYHQIDEWFAHHPVTESNFGLTHGDHRPGNVLYDGHQINIIDFDEPVYHWFISDIAMPFLDLSSKPHHEWKHLFDWFIEGYRLILPIDEEDLRSINRFTQMKSLGIYLWCKNEWHEPTAPGGKPREQWLSELRQMALTPLFPFR